MVLLQLLQLSASLLQLSDLQLHVFNDGVGHVLRLSLFPLHGGLQFRVLPPDPVDQSAEELINILKVLLCLLLVPLKQYRLLREC